MSDRADEKRGLRALLDVRPGEWALALTMCGYFFLVITSFWILKPLKKAVFIEFYDERGLDLAGWHLDAAQAELVAKVANMFVAALAVVVFTVLARRFRRERLSFVFAGFFVVTLAVYAFALQHASHALAWTYYLYGDLYTTLMVTTFFAFLNDSVTPGAAKRLYGLIVLGGVAGGAFGSSSLAIWIDEVDRGTWMWICLGVQIVIALLAAIAGRIVSARGELAGGPAAHGSAKPVASGGNPALEGLRLVLRSRYLLAMVALLGLYDMVSTVVDFQFSSTVAQFLSGEAIGQHFATVFTITNVTALVLQLFVTTQLMQRFRLSVTLVVTPIAIAAMSVGFLIVPLLWTGSLLNTADKAFNYSTNQSSREALYTATSRDEKYKAKAFIDMFVHRFAKAIAVGMSLAITSVFTAYSAVRWLTILTLVLVVVWVVIARYLGARFRELAKEDGADARHDELVPAPALPPTDRVARGGA